MLPHCISSLHFLTALPHCTSYFLPVGLLDSLAQLGRRGLGCTRAWQAAQGTDLRHGGEQGVSVSVGVGVRVRVRVRVRGRGRGRGKGRGKGKGRGRGRGGLGVGVG